MLKGISINYKTKSRQYSFSIVIGNKEICPIPNIINRKTILSYLNLPANL